MLMCIGRKNKQMEMLCLKRPCLQLQRHEDCSKKRQDSKDHLLPKSPAKRLRVQVMLAAVMPANSTDKIMLLLKRGVLKK